MPAMWQRNFRCNFVAVAKKCAMKIPLQIIFQSFICNGTLPLQRTPFLFPVMTFYLLMDTVNNMPSYLTVVENQVKLKHKT